MGIKMWQWFMDDPRHHTAVALLTTSPLWIGILVQLKPHLPVAPTSLELAFSALVGLTVSIHVWIIRVLVGARQRERQARQFSEVQEAVALVPPRELMRTLIGPLPEPVLDYVAREREIQHTGFLSLRNDQRWELSTPRAYESLVHFMQRAKHVNIVDHDIRRWFELINQPDQKATTSTTFNYSQHILGVAQDCLQKGQLKSYRRIFMLNPQLPCDLNKLDEWERMDPAVQVLLTIWEFEDRLRKKPGMEKVLGTRTLVHDAGETGPLVEQIKEYKDLVIINRDICVYEDLHCDRQTTNSTSFQTKSWLYTGESYAVPRLDFFEKLWPHAQGVGPDLRKAFDRIPKEQRIRVLGGA